MDLHPLPAELALRQDLGLLAQRGEARRLHQGARTITEVLREASRQMDEQDERERQAADPLHFVRLPRRRSLWNRLLGRI